MADKEIVPFKCRICLSKVPSYDYAHEISAWNICKICRYPICFWHLTWQSKIRALFLKRSNLICIECYKKQEKG